MRDRPPDKGGHDVNRASLRGGQALDVTEGGPGEADRLPVHLDVARVGGLTGHSRHVPEGGTVIIAPSPSMTATLMTWGVRLINFAINDLLDPCRAKVQQPRGHRSQWVIGGNSLFPLDSSS